MTVSPLAAGAWRLQRFNAAQLATVSRAEGVCSGCPPP